MADVICIFFFKFNSLRILLVACSFKISRLKQSQHVCCWLCSTSAPGKIALLCLFSVLRATRVQTEVSAVKG